MVTHPWVFVGILLLSGAIGYWFPRDKHKHDNDGARKKQE